MLFLYLTVFITAVGFSMVFPMLPYYAQTFEASAFLIGLLAASHSLANFIASPLLGRVSDRFGRKPVILSGLLIGSGTFIIMGLANSLWLLFAGRIIHGIVSAAINPTARAYMADLTTGKQRVEVMGKVGAATASGILIGPALSSFLTGTNGIHTPFFVAAGVSLINAFLVFILLKESIKEKTQKLVIREGFLNIFGIFKHLRGQEGLLFLCLFVWSFSMSNKQVSFPLLGEDKFNIGPEHIGYFFTAAAFLSITIQGFLLNKIVRVLGEKLTIFAGLFIMGIATLILPFTPTLISLVIVYLFWGVGGSINRPTAEGIISRVSETGQGTTMGVAQSFESLGRVAGPISAGMIYTLAPEGPFIISAIMLLIVGFFILINFSLDKK